jgi:cytochrome P450
MPGVSMLNINSIELAQELLGKRTNTTGGRKIGYMVKHLMGWEWSLAFMNPGPTLLEHRKLLRRGIGPQRISSHNPLIERATAEMMVKLKAFEGDPAIIVKVLVQVDLILYEAEMSIFQFNRPNGDTSNLW